jgi:hypothetical protein
MDIKKNRPLQRQVSIRFKTELQSSKEKWGSVLPENEKKDDKEKLIISKTFISIVHGLD